MTAPRIFLTLLCLLVLSPALPATQFDEIDRRAQALAAAPYQPQDKTIPAEARAIDYGSYQSIRFDRHHAIWPPGKSSKTPFHLEFFYRAFIFPERVDIHLIDRSGKITPVPFDPAMFSMADGTEKQLPTQLPANYSFSGLKVYYDFGHPRTREEAIIFQGASYFRIPSPGQYFGLSARGLAINTAHPGLGEEFPAFKTFWVQEPAPGSKQITIYALLDGPTVTGAYEFLVQPDHPSHATTVDVKATLHYRATPGRVGYAPLTSMFWFGENNYREFSDYRYQVHDSDGLLILEQDGARLWRPLQTVTRDLVDYFTSKETPKAFGLLQRDRDFGHHNDIEAHYHQRPTLWVEPGKEWPKGSIVLWQIPTTDEYHDNIVAYWMPRKNPAAGETHTITYRLLTTVEEPPGLPDSGQVIGTYMIPSYGRLDRFLIMVDFAWPNKKQPSEEPPKIEVEADGAEILAQYVKPNPDAHAWRAHFVIQFPSKDMRNVLTCRLTDEKGRSTEKWTYTFVPQGKIEQ